VSLTSKKQALVCSYHPVQPDRDSGARRVFQSVESLIERGWGVSFLTSDGLNDPADKEPLQQLGVTVYDARKDSVPTLFREQQFDLAVFAFWPNAERYLPLLRKLSRSTRIIVDSVDLHFLRETRKVFSSTGPHSGALLGDKFGPQITSELNTYASADAVLTVSQKEADLLNDLLGPAGLAVLVPDGEELQLSTVPLRDRRGILCVGSFEHAPNVQAVRWLCSEILPRINQKLLQKHPVQIVGNALNDSITAFGRGSPNTKFIGWVPDVAPYFERARISVVPLLYGAGTKRKLIQALTIGTPSVSTSIGIEGLGLKDRQTVLVADDAERFATAIERLLTDDRLWTRLSCAGHKQITRTHSLTNSRKRFFEVINKVLAKPPNISRIPYETLVALIQESATRVIPAGASVLVVSKGDDSLLQMTGRRAAHFPQDANGNYSGYYPKDSAAAIDHLKTVQRGGATYLVLPRTSLWWLDHYIDFAKHLDSRGEKIFADETCFIYRLRLTQKQKRHNERPPSVPFSPGQGKVRNTRVSRSVPTGTRLIAFYLPQFHPIPENDLWWGEGFTEWHNVAKASPQFPGHYQPHVPADLGFYDLRLAETRDQQAALARAYGIHGFCYYHYWFNGKRLLERPFQEVLASGSPDFPFCLCWANDPWSRRWDGREADLLQAQTYSEDDDVAHIRALLPALADKRAISINGKPIFLVYRARHLPTPQKTTEVWRKQIKKAGLPGIYLIAVETAWDLGWDATSVGFDAKVLFQPQFGWLATHATKHGARIPIPGNDNLQVYDYAKVIEQLKTLKAVSYRRFDSVFPGWDNTARVGDTAVVLHRTSPALYQQWLSDTIAKTAAFPKEERVVFINAWNEWAEGCHLEPDLQHGLDYLEATANAVQLDRTRAAKVT
jgi:glycosyltransferase involved in cell wall biosynthesis